MSAAPALAFRGTRNRAFPRYPLNVQFDLVALRCGVPETFPGRCLEISEAGVGAIVAAELFAGQHVAVELRLPNVSVPLQTRALVRHQSRLRCGLEFSGLSLEQRETIRYWGRRPASQSAAAKARTAPGAAKQTESPVVAAPPATKPRPGIRIGRRGFRLLIALLFALTALGWWQWQRSWNDLENTGTENRMPAGESQLRVSPATMAERIVTKVDPVYPEAARTSGIEGLVVLDAVIAPDGSVKSLRPVSGNNLLAQSAASAVQLWKFEPYLSTGKAIEVETTVAVEFRLN